MTELYEVPFESRSFEQVRDYYHRQYPILRAYDEIIQRYSDPDRSINEPSSGGLDTVRVAELALRMIGRPPRDRDDTLMAVQYIRSLQNEMSEQFPQDDPDLADGIISAEYPWSGCVLDAETFESMTKDRQVEHVEMIVNELSEDYLRSHLREALLIALPEVYRQITVDMLPPWRGALTRRSARSPA